MLKFPIYIDGLNNTDYYAGRPVGNLGNLSRCDALFAIDCLQVYNGVSLKVVTYIVMTFRQFRSSRGNIINQIFGFKSRYEIPHHGMLNI